MVAGKPRFMPHQKMSQRHNFANFTIAVSVPQASPKSGAHIPREEFMRTKGDPVLVHRLATKHHRHCLHAEPGIETANIYGSPHDVLDAGTRQTRACPQKFAVWGERQSLNQSVTRAVMAGT